MINIASQEIWEEITRVGKAFRLAGTPYTYDVIKNGNINATYKVTYQGEGNALKSYIFQKINTYVFKNPVEIMQNIDYVTTHIRKKCPDRVTLHFYHTEEGKNYLYAEGGFWRVMNYIESITYNICEDLDIIRATGEAYGEFQMELSDFDGKLLYETLPDFHNTKKRLDMLFLHVWDNVYGRVEEASEEIEYIKSVREKASALSEKYNNGEFPVRVAHNDTKLNNILFSKETNKPLVVIDLDTVMPGLALYDYGDAARSICNTAKEDEPDLSKVGLSMEKFKVLTEGFLSKVKNAWTKEETENLILAMFSITIELAARFLDDYITGDKYFKINYPDHNIVRARCQIKLAKSIEENYDEMCEFVRSF